MTDLKNKLTEILQGVNPKQYARQLQQFPEIVAELESSTKQYNPKNISEQVYIIINSPPAQQQCGKYPQFNTFNLGYRQFCGPKTVCSCAKQKQSADILTYHQTATITQKQISKQKKENTCLSKYGVKNAALHPDIKLKTQNTNIERYGAASPFESNIVRSKIKEVCKERYGVETPFESKEVRQKGIDTTIARYGSLMSQARESAYAKYGMNPFAHPTVKEKIKSTLQDKYNRSCSKHLQLTDEQLAVLQDYDKFKELLTNKTFKLAGEILGVNDTTIGRYCEYYKLRDVKAHTKSINEHFIKTILDELNIKYIQNTRAIISPYELDFYLPDYKSAIEVGSIWYHSELNGKRNRFYHWNKWTACAANGISLYQWFDDEIKNNSDVIKNKIMYITNNIHTKIGARQVTIGNITLTEEREFLDKNHIQGFSSDRQYVFGGYYNNQVVSVIAFKNRPQYNDIELTRYATQLGVNFPGLFSKMFKYALSILPNTDIISFSANCHSNGNMYNASGFQHSHFVKPTYFYTKDYHTKFGRYQYTKKKILEKHPNLDSTKTEWELMQQLGYDRIWDSGKIAWIYPRR